MTVCLTCKRRNECDHKWKDDEFMVGCTGYIESRTYFERVTESPEKLAEFIYCLVEACDYAAGNGAKKISQYANEDANDKRHIELIHGNRDFGELLDWLNEEYKNE